MVSSVVLDHNHDFSTLGKAQYFKSNRMIGSFVKRKLKLNDMARIRPNKNFNSFVVETDGHENVPFLEKDHRNVCNLVMEMLWL